MTLFCHLRRTAVRDTPEETVRQAVLDVLLHKGGCPRHWLAVEVALADIAPTSLRRRLDIVCFRAGCLPLLVIECKASAIKREAYWQINGYNFFVKAPLTALASPDSLMIYQGAHVIYQGSIQEMPTYEQLCLYATSSV